MMNPLARWGVRVAFGLAVAAAVPAAAFAQSPSPGAPPQPPPPAAPPQPPPAAASPEAPPAAAPEASAPAQPPPEASDPDVRADPLQPDFSLAALPVTLRLPAHKFAFRVTHRFLRSVGADDVGGLLGNLFEFDSGAQIGLDVRYGVLPGTQIGIQRTSDRTIELFGQQSVMQQQPDGHPIGLDAIVALEGLDNLRGHKMGAIGAIVSRKLAAAAAVYVEPIFVARSNLVGTGDDNTFMIGLGARVRVRPKLYLVGEVTPRVSGFAPGVNQGSFGVETRAGGHTFQLNFSNGFGTTLGQLARGGIDNHSWFIGFNISRKFY